jgi:hypothetical protein
MAPFNDMTARYTRAHAWGCTRPAWRPLSTGHATSSTSDSCHISDRAHGFWTWDPAAPCSRYESSNPEAERFFENYTTPRILGGVNLAIFRTWIAGRSIDLDDARDLVSRIDRVDKGLSRIAGIPILMISGRRPSAAPEGPAMDS